MLEFKEVHVIIEVWNWYGGKGSYTVPESEGLK